MHMHLEVCGCEAHVAGRCFILRHFWPPRMPPKGLCFIQPYNSSDVKVRIQSLKLLYSDSDKIQRLKEVNIEENSDNTE